MSRQLIIRGYVSRSGRKKTTVYHSMHVKLVDTKQTLESLQEYNDLWRVLWTMPATVGNFGLTANGIIIH